MLEVLRKLATKKAPPPICSAVIVAAGSARRLEGIDKVLAPLGELPVLVHTIYSFQDCPRFDEIVVVTREDLLVEVSRICKDFQLDKVSKVVVGGRERTDSVLAGLREVRPDADLIAIHDGARPLAPQQVLEEVVERAAEAGASFVYPALGVTMREGQREYFLQGLEDAFPGQGLRARYLRRYGDRYWCASPRARRLWEVFSHRCGQLGMRYRMEQIVSAATRDYGDRQLSFF